MKIQLTVLAILLSFAISASAQETDLYKSANVFLNSLDKNQKTQAQLSFDSSERYRWNFVPLNDRKGISMNEMSPGQKNAAIALMKSSLSENAYKKATQIMALENVLKAIEKRQESDHYRDPGKYFFTVFGEPSKSLLAVAKSRLLKMSGPAIGGPGFAV